MAYVSCPRCGAEDVARVEVIDQYDYETNSGGAPELTELECDCRIEDLTPDQIDDAIVEAIGKYPLSHLHWSDGRV